MTQNIPNKQKHLLPSEAVGNFLVPPRKPRPRSELITKEVLFGSCSDLSSTNEAVNKRRRRRTSLMKMCRSEVNLSKTVSFLDLSERGAPEGQEDPAINTSFCSGVVGMPKSVYKPNKTELMAWAGEKLNNRKLERFPLYIKHVTLVAAEIDLELKVPSKKPLRTIQSRFSLEEGETIKKCWNLLSWQTDDSCQSAVFSLTTHRVCKLMPDGSFIGSITLANITHIEISCNYTRIDIVGNCLMSLLVPDHELCLSIVSFVEHLRRNFGLIDTVIHSPNYELLEGSIFDCFILRDVDGGGAFQLDVADETASGHMMYCRLHKEKVIRWVSGFFVLRGRVLQCFTAAKAPHAKWDIPLRESGMSVTLGSNTNYRPNTIELWYQSKTVLILAASSSEEAYKWFTKISRTLDALSPVKMHRPLTLQHRILVFNSSGIFLLKWDKKHLRQEISAKLEQLGTIKLDPELDSAFLSVDFEWQEAEDLAGDWVLHFPTWKHMEEFLSSIRDHLPETAEICYFEEGSYLLQRCRNVSEVLSFDYTEEK